MSIAVFTSGGEAGAGVIQEFFLEGPIVRELFETFQKSWYTWGGEKIDFRKKPGEATGLRQDKDVSTVSDFLPRNGAAICPPFPSLSILGKGEEG